MLKKLVILIVMTVFAGAVTLEGNVVTLCAEK